jgi:branched-subunit amino acid transport protein
MTLKLIRSFVQSTKTVLDLTLATSPEMVETLSKPQLLQRTFQDLLVLVELLPKTSPSKFKCQREYLLSSTWRLVFMFARLAVLLALVVPTVTLASFVARTRPLLVHSVVAVLSQLLLRITLPPEGEIGSNPWRC